MEFKYKAGDEVEVTVATGTIPKVYGAKIVSRASVGGRPNVPCYVVRLEDGVSMIYVDEMDVKLADPMPGDIRSRFNTIRENMKMSNDFKPGDLVHIPHLENEGIILKKNDFGVTINWVVHPFGAPEASIFGPSELSAPIKTDPKSVALEVLRKEYDVVSTECELLQAKREGLLNAIEALEDL